VTSGRSPVLSYNTQQHVVRLSLTRAAALTSLTPPEDLIQRAMTKLEKVKDEGRIEFYQIYEETLEAVWSALRESSKDLDDVKINFVLGAGAPKIEGLIVTNSDVKNPGILVTTTGPLDTNKINVEWVRTRVLKVARDHNVYDRLFLPHISSVISRIVAGDTLSNVLIQSGKPTPSFHQPEKPFAVFVNKSRFEVIGYIHELSSMQSEPAIDRLCDLVSKAVQKLEAAGSPDLLILRDDIARLIRCAMTGPERLGIGMPLTVLAAMEDLSKTLGKKFLNFIVSDDKMTAKISDFDVSVYDDAEFKITKEFVVKQLRMSDLKGDIPDSDLTLLVEAAAKRENLDGKVAGRGLQPSAGVDPYIHLVYKDAPKSLSDNEIINIRDSQQRSIVQAGQLIAEIRYLKPEVIGLNLLGEPLNPEPGPSMDVVLGEGVLQTQPGKFFAEFGGVPTVEDGNKLGLIKSHVHEGDVNLKSGNIYFDGPVEIKGSVDAGALVRVKGPLKVYGSIIGGTVISKEPIEVVESIVTGQQGKVICSTHIKADFIENSNIECDGSLVVTKSLVSSDVVAGDYIQALAPDGIIGGGTIMCRNLVAAANIGFTKGARTKFVVGVDHRVIRRTKIREKRLKNLLEAQERYKLEFRELTQKKDGQLTQKHKQMKEILKNKMANIRPLIETISVQLEAMKSSVTFIDDCLIAATNVFAANCSVEVGGQGVVMEADTMAVGISARKRRDSHLCTYDEIKSEIERKLAGSGQAPAVSVVPDSPAPVVASEPAVTESLASPEVAQTAAAQPAADATQNEETTDAPSAAPQSEDAEQVQSVESTPKAS
jgi:uncharacterized protein (DUF342 family)